MKYQRVVLAGVCLAVVALILATDVSSALAQRSPTPPERRLHPGKYPFGSNQRASRNIRHARDYSRDLYYYSRDAKKVEPEVAKSESEQLGKNIELAKKEIATVRKEAGDDKETLAALEVIEKHLARAAEVHKSLHAECCKDSVDGSVCMECCSDITKELEKALAEHGALMRKLEQKARAEAQKDASKKGN